MNIVNIAAYKFMDIKSEALLLLKKEWKQKAMESQLKGTILLSTEGINFMLAGSRADIEEFKKYVARDTRFSDLSYKESFSEEYPFSRLVVRIKEEIITFGQPDVNPAEETAPHISPETLQQWYRERRDMVVLDTRNDYEVAIGTFRDAVSLSIENFRDFSAAVEQLPESFKEKPVVTFCTGGIRCEKAAAWMQKQGFREVYQLDGGILNYLKTCGGDYFQGECFVFDDRVALDAGLTATGSLFCSRCGDPVTLVQQAAGGCLCDQVESKQ